MFARFDTSPAAIAPYREAYRRRGAQDRREREARARRAWAVARRCSDVLHNEFGANRVAVFGSLARGTFGLRSDIDLAVWNLAPSSYVEALARLMEVAGEFEIDLALYERCAGAMTEAIERDAVTP